MPRTEHTRPRNLTSEEQKQARAWNKKLAAEGMPTKLPSVFQEILKTSDSANAAARAFAAERAHDMTTDFSSTGEHEKFAAALASQFSLSIEEARELVASACDQADSFYGRSEK